MDANKLGPTEFGARVGATRQRVKNWQKGINGVPVDMAVKIRSEFGVTLDWLYTGDDKFMPLGTARSLGLAPSSGTEK